MNDKGLNYDTLTRVVRTANIVPGVLITLNRSCRTRTHLDHGEWGVLNDVEPTDGGPERTTFVDPVLVLAVLGKAWGDAVFVLSNVGNGARPVWITRGDAWMYGEVVCGDKG